MPVPALDLGLTRPIDSREEGLPNLQPKADNLSIFNTDREPINPENSIDLLKLGSPFAMSGAKEMLVQKDTKAKAEDGFPRFIEKWRRIEGGSSRAGTDLTWKMFQKTPFLNKTGTFEKYSAKNPSRARKYDFLSKTLDNRYEKVVEGVRKKNCENRDISVDPKRSLVGTQWEFVDSIPNKMVRKKIGKASQRVGMNLSFCDVK